MDDGSVGITWVFLLVLNMSLNTLLWTISYPEVRQAHSKDEAEALINKALDVLDGCEGRWPGTGTSSELYSIFSKACLQSYESQGYQPQSVLTTPPPASETSASPDSTYNAAGGNGQQPVFNPPQFGYVFDSPPEAMNNYTMDPSFPPPQPSFRSNSIFQNPATHDHHGRRFSYFPPDFTQMDETTAPDDSVAPSIKSESHLSSPPDQLFGQMPTPPDSMANMSSAASNVALSPPNVPLGQQQAPPPMGVQPTISPPAKINPAQPQATQRIPPYTLQQNTQPTQRAMPQQRPLPQQPPSATTQGDWFSPPAAFISPYNFGQMGSTFYNDLSNMNTFGDFSGSGLGMQGLGTGAATNQQGFDRPLPGRQGSLTHSQQLELMNVLETEGATDIDAFLKAGNIPDARWY